MIIHLHAFYRGQHIKKRPPFEPGNTIVKPLAKENTSRGAWIRPSITAHHRSDTSAHGIQTSQGGRQGSGRRSQEKERRFDYALTPWVCAKKSPDKTEPGIFTFGDNISSPISTFRASSPWREDLGRFASAFDAARRRLAD